MKKENQRIAIAEFMGYVRKSSQYWSKGSRNFGFNELPDIDDLNAIHEAEKHLTEDQLRSYDGWLIMCSDDFSSRRATAPQRVESLLRTIEKWEEFD